MLGECLYFVNIFFLILMILVVDKNGCNIIWWSMVLIIDCFDWEDMEEVCKMVVL